MRLLRRRPRVPRAGWLRVRGVWGDGGVGVRPGQHGRGRDREQRRELVADPAGLAVLGYLTQRGQQPAGPVDVEERSCPVRACLAGDG